MNKFYLIDKPYGITSFDILRQLKKKLSLKKMWHTWTLDPLATGLVFVACGNYTKLIPYFEKDTKSYTATILLDGVTDSYDAETPVRALSPDEQAYFKQTLDVQSVQKVLWENFSGTIKQMPPKYSALKIGGQKALDLVRKGKEFELQARDATIFSIEILSYSYPRLELACSVSAGTYIRSIAHDLGQLLGCGGYIESLRRTKIGKLDFLYAQTLDDFSPEKSVPVQALFPIERLQNLADFLQEKLNNGMPYPSEDRQEDGVYFLQQDHEISYIIEKKEGMIFPLRKI